MPKALRTLAYFVISITLLTDATAGTTLLGHGFAGRPLAIDGDVTTYSGWLATHRDDGHVPTGAPDTVPALARLEPAYPNPFNPSTTIAFTAGGGRQLALSIHDLRGRRIVGLARGIFAAGRHEVRWHGRDAAGRAVPSGVYLVRLHGAGVESSRTVTLVK